MTAENLVEHVRDLVSDIVRLDNQYGGNCAARVAVPAFRSLRGRQLVDARDCVPDRDVLRAEAELAEVTGWALFDAGRHGSALRISAEALRRSRLAEHRQMEFLVLQNQSAQASHLGWARVASSIAEEALALGPVSARMESLFLVRLAHGLALSGQNHASIRTLRRAGLKFGDGLAEADPSWLWWFDERELQWHEARCRGALGDWGPAAELYYEAASAPEEMSPRDAYLYLSSLCHALVAATSLHEAATIAERLQPYADRCCSDQVLTELRASAAATSTLRPTPVQRRLEDALRQLVPADRARLCGRDA